ncbi:MAG: hypothetical protein Q7T18_06285, partial [Sedimentisphaerales bacterium]|nr:hypothetical protein [Sedimentisphaerales bacterium]
MRTRLYVWLIIFSCALFTKVQSSSGAVNSNDPNQACAAGLEFEKQLQYDNAATVYGEVIAKYPATPQAQFCRARTVVVHIQKAMNSENYVQARQYARSLMVDFKDYIDV